MTGTTGTPTLLHQEIANPTPQVAMMTSSLSDTTLISKPVSKQNKAVSTSDDLSQMNRPVAKIATNAGVEEAVREYFADIPLMIEIAKAESKFRQFGKDGEALRGVAVKEDRGVFQINETYHLLRSRKLGYDIHTLAGNMAYARRLYEESGPQPWASSYSMWGKSPLAANFKPRNRAAIVVATAINKNATTPSEANAAVGTPVSAVTTSVSAPITSAPAEAMVAGEEIISPAANAVREIPQVVQTTQSILSE